MVSCLTEVLRGGGSYTTLRCLWGFFCASLAKTDPLYRVTWNNPETLVSFEFDTSALVLGAVGLSSAGFLYFSVVSLFLKFCIFVGISLRCPVPTCAAFRLRGCQSHQELQPGVQRAA